MNVLSECIQDLNESILDECMMARVASGAPKQWRGERIFASWPIKVLKGVACFAVIVAVAMAAVILPTLKRPFGQQRETTTEGSHTAETETETESDIPIDEPQDIVSDLSQHDAVKEVIPIIYEGPWSEYPAYQIQFVSDGLSMNAHLVLPIDTPLDTPLVFYFPEYAHSKEDLPAKFAANGFAVAMLKTRGDTSNAGINDYGGKDFVDVLTLYDMMMSTKQFADSKCLAMGVSIGSVRALRLAAEKGDAISACFVANPYTDIKGLGEDFLKFCSGVTYQEAPEEYELRSAVTFADRLVSPVYMAAFPASSNFQSQHDAFVKAMADAGRELHVSLYEGVPFTFTIDVMKDMIPKMQEAVGMASKEVSYPPQDLPSKEAFSLEPPTDALLFRFIAESEAYQRRDSHYDPKYQYPFWIDRYYGRFGEVVFIYWGGGGLMYSDAEWTDCVAGYEYRYSDGNRIRVWAHGTFMSMEEAYEQGIITKEQVAVIYGEGKSIKVGAAKTCQEQDCKQLCKRIVYTFYVHPLCIWKPNGA